MFLQNFSVVNTKVKKIKNDLELNKLSDAFYFILLQ